MKREGVGKNLKNGRYYGVTTRQNRLLRLEILLMRILYTIVLFQFTASFLSAQCPAPQIVQVTDTNNRQ